MLAQAGVAPRGFVAPGYAYPPALRRELSAGYEWWATLMRLVGRDRAAIAPALAPQRFALAALVGARVLRLDLHPADFDRPRHVLSLERVLARERKRVALTYDDLCAPQFAPPEAGVAATM